MLDAKASNWALEKFRVEGISFVLVGSTESYASFNRGFNDGDTVFYAAADDDGNREAGYGVYRANRITERVPTATLIGQVYNDKSPAPLPFSKGGTIAGTFNAIAFNTLWEHLSDEDNPHNVTADQIELDPELDFGDAQNVQKALEYIFGRFTKVQDDIPQSPEEGDLWFDTGHTAELYVYHNGSWISTTGAGGGGGGGSIPDNVVLDDIDGTIVGKLLGREIDEDGKGRWRPIYTDDVVTRGAQPMFRSTETGRFTKATDPSAIRDQQTANWFLYESMMEMGDVHVDIDPPDDPQDGDMWYDTVRLELFVYAEGAWLPCSPLGARVDAGEILQADILSRVEAGEAKQAQIATTVDNKLGKDERNTVTEDFRILGDRKTFISANGNELGLYNLRTPTSGPHATNKEYVDGEIDRKIAAIELPESDVDKAYVDQQDDALDARITSGEQLQNQIFADVRENKSDISSISILSQQNYGNIDKKLDKAGGTVTGDIAMSGNKITGLADPTANAHAATKKYVDSKAGDIDGLQLDVGYRMHATWKYMGDSHQAENLADGEFTIRTEGGSNPIMKIYLAGQDTHGRRWYAWSDNKESYSHGFGAQYCSITDRDGEVRKAGKLTEGTFNNGGNQYVRLTCEWYKSNWNFTVGNYYTINAAGLLPHAHYIDHYEYNQSPKMVGQASNKEEESASVVIGLPMDEVLS